MLKKITYENKQNHSQNPEVPKYKKATADDFNELKEVINFNADEVQKEIDKWEAAKNDFVALNDFETFKNATNNSLANKVENSVYQNDKQNLEAAIDKLKNEKLDKTVFETLKNDFDNTKQEHKQAIDKNKTDIQNNLNEINTIKNTSLINLNDEISKLKLELAKKVLQTDFDTFKNATDTSIQNFLNNFTQLNTYLTGLATEIQQMQDEIKQQLNWVLEIQINETYNKNDFGYVGDNWFICLKDGVNGDTTNPDNWKQVNFATGGGGQLPNLSNYYTKQEITALLTPKADVDYVDNNFVKTSQLNNYYTKPEVDSKEQAINAEIQKINTEIAKKANQTDLDELNKLVIEVEDVAYDNLNKIKNLTSQVQNNTEAIKKVNEASTDIDARFTKNEKAIAQNLTEITTLKNDLSDVGDAITDNLNKIRQNTTDITALQNKDINLENLINANKTSISQNLQSIQEINTKLTDAVKIKGNYQAGETYNKNDVVYDMQKWYISLENNNNTQPPSSKWALWSANFQPPNLTEYLRIDDFKLAANEIDKKIEANKNQFSNYVDITNNQTISGQKEFQNLKATIFKVPEIRDEKNSTLLNVNTSTFNKKVSYSSQPQNLTDLDIPSYKVVKDEVANVQIPNDVARTSIANTFTQKQTFNGNINVYQIEALGKIVNANQDTIIDLSQAKIDFRKPLTYGVAITNLTDLDIPNYKNVKDLVNTKQDIINFGTGLNYDASTKTLTAQQATLPSNVAKKDEANIFTPTQEFANEVGLKLKPATNTKSVLEVYNNSNTKIMTLGKTGSNNNIELQSHNGATIIIRSVDKTVWFGNSKLKEVANPTDATDAVNKKFIEDNYARKAVENNFSATQTFANTMNFTKALNSDEHMINFNLDNVSGNKVVELFKVHRGGKKFKFVIWTGDPDVAVINGSSRLKLEYTPTRNQEAINKEYADNLIKTVEGNGSIGANNFHTIQPPSGYKLFSVQVFRKGSANVWYSQDTGTDGTGFALYIADENSSTISIWNRTTPSGYTNDFAWRVIYKKV